jgi:LytS/YehU family sensor histidine kinase
MILFGMINSVVIGGLFIIGLSVITAVFDQKLPWLYFPLKRLVAQFLVTVAFSLVVIVIAIFFTSFLWHRELTSDFFLSSAFFMVKIAFSFILVGALISNSILFFKNWKEAAVQQEKLKREHLILQYETLKSQVNPHFLFNNMNSLTSLISSNPDKAIEFVKKLSEVYRYVLDQKNNELVDLSTELKFLSSYVFLQKIRFEENLVVQVDVKSGNFKVVPLSVQMLVENAIKHNEISDKKPLSIRVFIDDSNYLVVENRLQKKSGSEGSGSGIQNIKDRYTFFTDRRVVVTEKDAEFIVKVPLLTD